MARHIIESNQERTPDLGHIQVFIPNQPAAEQLKFQLAQLLQASALITPYIGPMEHWIHNHIPPDTDTGRIISPHSRQLLLLDAVNQHPGLFRNNSWQVTNALLKLFDDLTCNNSFDPELTEQQLNEILIDAYGNPAIQVKNLKLEASMIFTLWQAWQEQMGEMKILDEASAYAARLRSTAELDHNWRFYIIGYEQLSRTEKNWCQKNSGSIQFDYLTQNLPPETDQYLHSQSHDKDISRSDVDILFDQNLSLKQRKDAISNLASLQQKINIFSASSYEQEAQAIELQTRLWLLQKKNRIAIVSEDRKITRRLRALLDRAGISIQDTAGWALSTTSASTIIERWLECIEEDFPHQALLDLIKSPFFAVAENRQTHLEQVYHFEHDIVIHENIARDLQRYQSALNNRQHKLKNWSEERFNSIKTLLQNIEQASLELKTLQAETQKQPAEKFLQALLNSLEKLQIITALEADRAGKGILAEIDKMMASLAMNTATMSWSDFRTWLAGSLENQQLILNPEASAVTFMNFKQAQYCSFDAMIIAGANKDKLPGSAEQNAFFNQSVKQSLGLKDWKFKKNYFFYQFKCLLNAADTLLITYRHEHNGEWLPASPWVTSLQDIFRLSDSHSQSDIQQLIQQDCYISNEKYRDNLSLTQAPSCSLVENLRPKHYSPNSLQKIINCPYQFFTSIALALKAPEHISEELRKSEYGEKVHSILYHFHQKHKIIRDDNRDHAIEQLTKLSHDLFSQDIEDNVQHRGWLKRWLNTIPHYIDWQISWQKIYRIEQLESEHSIDIHDNTVLSGRIDRIDSSDEGFAIIDYKTGSPPSKNKVIKGEDIQLLSYASMINNSAAITYLKIDNGEVNATALIDNDTLTTLKDRNLERLTETINDLHQQHPLSAWGDSQACDYCDSQGLCRKQIWDNA